MTIPLIIFISLLSILYIGFSTTKSSSTKDYLFLTRKITTLPLVATLVTTWYGGINEIGIEVINYGLVTWLYFGFFYYVAAFIYSIHIAPRLIAKGYQSIPIAILDNYGKTPAIISLIILFLYLLPSPYILILGQLISQIFNIVDVNVAMLIGVILSCIYTLKGGFKSIIRTDKIQFVFMFCGFSLLFLTLLFSKDYGMSVLFDLFERNPEMLSIPGQQNWSYILVWGFFALATFIDPNFNQRVFAGKNLKTVQNSIKWAILCWFIFDMMTITSALFYFEIFKLDSSSIQNINSPYIELAFHVFSSNPVFLGLFFMSLLSVVMSTIDSYTFLAAATLQNDRSVIMNKKTNIKEIKSSIVLVLFLSLFVTFFFSRAIEMWYFFGTLMVVTILVPMLCILFDVKLYIVGTLMLSSLFITIIWEFFIYQKEIYFLPSLYVGLIINLLFILYSNLKYMVIKKGS